MILEDVESTIRQSIQAYIHRTHIKIYKNREAKKSPYVLRTYYCTKKIQTNL